MPLGKSIRIYLADGSVSGIRHGEVANWSGQALACPRNRFGELQNWPEIRRPGVYFLFGVDDEAGRDAVYIGEAEVVAERLASHISGKDFWTDLVAFTSKDDNLTKGHVRYLEARLVKFVSGAGRYALKNSNSPSLPALPRADRDSMDDFIEFVRLLLGVFGHRALDPLTPRLSPVAVVEGSPTPLTMIDARSAHPIAPDTEFFLRMGSINASALKTDEGLVVLAGSESAITVQPSLSTGYRALHERLIAAGVLANNGGKYRFTSEHLFSSPSQAAAVIVGYSVNGREAWKTSDGRTWGQVEETAASQLLDEVTRVTAGPAGTDSAV
jgi:hypothetical protein